MKKRFVLAVMVVVCVLIGVLAVHAQLRDPGPRDTSWRNRMVVGLPDDEVGDDESGDEEGDDEGDDCLAYPAPVPKSGQTECWDDQGDPIDCGGTGHDGDYQAGASADPRFTENGDGTVTDNLTGLIWLQDAGCIGERRWEKAILLANTLDAGLYWGVVCGLADGSVAGDWRLPSVKELLSLIDFGQHDPALPPGHPFLRVQSSFYWTSTTHAERLHRAWGVFLRYGNVDEDDKDLDDNSPVWPVRGGL